MKNTKNELIVDEMREKIINATEEIVMTTEEISVRTILKALNISNRVFYNRFHNLQEVLDIVYEKIILKVREGMEVEYDQSKDFFEYVTDLVTNTLIASFTAKRKFNKYVFELDSNTNSNYEWYMKRINNLFTYAMNKGLIKEIDLDTMGYSIWCFCRGFNADAVSRMGQDEAVEKFRYSFKILLDGLKK